MSRFSGKCDFWDHLFSSTDDEEKAFDKFNGTKLYIRQALPEDFNLNKALEEKVNIPETYYKKIEYDCIEDLIPYYPYLIVMAYYDNTDVRSSVVCLSEKSFVDIEESEFLNRWLGQIIKEYKKCKRKKVDFSPTDVLSKISIFRTNDAIMMELCNRVKEKGTKANIDGLHLNGHNWYRKELKKEMIKHDIDPIVYGLE